MDDVKVFKVSSENLEDINKAFKNNNYTIIVAPSLSMNPLSVDKSIIIYFAGSNFKPGPANL